MRVGSLFSGVGGIEYGFEQQGFKTEWFIENNTYCQKILKKRFPGTKIYGDIEAVDFTKVSRVDVLTGGFPCQDISNAGKRDGIEGSRSSLWKYYFEAIRQIRPRVAFIENVSALTHRGLHVVLRDLAEIGYDAEWHCISASSIGAPHCRDRIFIIAYPSENGCGQTSNRKSQQNGQDVANSNKKRFQSGLSSRKKKRLTPLRISCKNEKEHIFRRNKGSWATESRICGVAHGVPNRVDRIKCLGNAVVPQCAEVFAKAITERIKEAQQ